MAKKNQIKIKPRVLWAAAHHKTGVIFDCTEKRRNLDDYCLHVKVRVTPLGKVYNQNNPDLGDDD